jgi:hypothetical protein
LHCIRSAQIAPLAAIWDDLVPRDQPHLRSSFLRAAELSGMMVQPNYLLVRHQDRPVGCAIAYTVFVDTMRHAPADQRYWVDRIRQRWPRFLWQPMRVCGSPVSNGESGICLAPGLSPPEIQHVFDRIVAAVSQATPIGQTLYFKDFRAEALAYAARLEALGYFPVSSGAGTALELRWSSLEAYAQAMRKHYRKLLKKDQKMAEGLVFELLEDFARLAPTVMKLYEGVYAQAGHVLEKANERFFAEVSRCDQARLLVAREKSTGTILAVNLLLFGDRLMQNLFVGFDYARNKQYHVYFSIVEESIRIAIERKCSLVLLGQDSYAFKARLGAVPFPLTAYMKHRLWPMHALLRSKRDTFFPSDAEVVQHDVFGPELGNPAPD